MENLAMIIFRLSLTLWALAEIVRIAQKHDKWLKVNWTDYAIATALSVSAASSLRAGPEILQGALVLVIFVFIVCSCYWLVRIFELVTSRLMLLTIRQLLVLNGLMWPLILLAVYLLYQKAQSLP